MTTRIPGRPSHSTANGWRPAYLDKARLVQASSSGPSQAIVGDVVTVFRLMTPPTGFYNNEPGCLLLHHWGGSGYVPGTRGTGTAGVWELVRDETLSIDGTPIDRVTPEYRVFLLAEAVRGLKQEEREAVLEMVAKVETERDELRRELNVTKSWLGAFVGVAQGIDDAVNHIPGRSPFSPSLSRLLAEYDAASKLADPCPPASPSAPSSGPSTSTPSETATSPSEKEP